MKRRTAMQRQTILRLLEQSPLSVADLSAKLGISSDAIRNRLRELKNAGQVYVSGWANHLYAFERLYSIGSEPDIPKPSYADYKQVYREQFTHPVRPTKKICFKLDFFDEFMFKVVSTRSTSC